MHMIMAVTGVPPKHIQEGAEVVLGETPAKIVAIGGSPAYSVPVAFPPWHAQFMIPNSFNTMATGATVSCMLCHS